MMVAGLQLISPDMEMTWLFLMLLTISWRGDGVNRADFAGVMTDAGYRIS